MKNTGIEWIGDIPDSWKTERLQWHLFEVREKNEPLKTNQILSLTNKLGVIPYEEKGDHGNKAKENLEDYKIAYPDTIVANSMNILIGSVGICKYYGCVSPVYYVFKPREKENLDYLNYIFQTQEFQKELRKYANGILEIRLRLSASDILKREVPYPNLGQQKKIVDFLKKKEKEINDLLNIEEEQLMVLEELKQSKINEAFTSIETNLWKLKYLTSGICDGTHGSFDRVQEGKYLLSAKNLGDGQLVISDNESMVSEEDYIQIVKNGYPQKGDILMCCVGDVGKSLIYNEDEQYAFQRSVMFIRPNKKIRSEFLLYALKTTKVIIQETKLINKTIQAGLYQGLVKELKIPFTDLKQQDEIVKKLDYECKTINELIKLKREKINYLSQYKKSLIYEYVTGKKEVA